MKQVVSDFPTIETAYDEEFGRVDPEVYQAAKTLWLHAENLAVKLLHDAPKGLRLMMKAVAKVSRVRENNPAVIHNLNSYLYRAYKNLLLAELEQENNRIQILDRWFREREAVLDENEEAKINKKILINELRLRMDDWTRGVFDLLRLGYKYEELVPQFGSAGNVIRSRFSKKTAQLVREIQAEIRLTDKKINRLP
jgi:hypothetical protein